MAMYFSRAPIPVFRNDVPELDKCYKHIGIYAYRAGFVEELVGLKQSNYEKYEKLEQLSALYEGYKIQMDEACMKPGVGVDTESDLFELKEALKDANN
jgi:3-deoxy-manno-octulosonate cytidylyltransferase (CMP-KDO synthetase)